MTVKLSIMYYTWIDVPVIERCCTLSAVLKLYSAYNNDIF